MSKWLPCTAVLMALSFAMADDPPVPRRGLTTAQVDHIIDLTQSNFWGNAKGRDGKLLIPADEEEKHRLLIPRADGLRVVKEAHKYGLALWCNIDWRSIYLEYMQAERDKGWNEKQIGFIGMLFGVTQGQTARLLEETTCTSEDKSEIRQAMNAEHTRISNATKR